ncbi:DUF2381 family protein [Corallococcus exiguus]|nr:DUF2381 family protein [Corallococcus exiguus]
MEIHLAVNSAQPWIGKGAMLRTNAGVELKVLRLWQEHPISTGEVGRIVVDAEASAAAAQGPSRSSCGKKTGLGPSRSPT